MTPPFQHPRLIELNYASGIKDLLGSLIPRKRPWQSFEDWLIKLGTLGASDKFQTLSYALAARMVRHVDAANAKTWQLAAQRSMQSRQMYAALQQELHGNTGTRFRNIVEENALLIRSIPADIAISLNKEIAKGQQQGLRAGAIGKALRARFPELTRSKINLISRTQTAAATTSLTEARCLDIGLDWFMWDTSDDQRVRPAHKNLNGVLISWHALPSPEKLIGQKSSLGRYAPGRCPNCRCFPSPLLNIDDVQWPHRVFHNDRIVRMTRAQFLNVSGMPVRRAA